MKKKPEPTTLEKLNALIARHGSIDKTAYALGITSRTIYRWKEGKGILPLYAQAIDRAYKELG